MANTARLRSAQTPACAAGAGVDRSAGGFAARGPGRRHFPQVYRDDPVRHEDSPDTTWDVVLVGRAPVPRSGCASSYLPGFGPSDADGPDVTPALPLALYDLGVREAPRRGPGAPLSLRLFVEACLSVPLEKRDSASGIEFEAVRFRDVLVWAGVNPRNYVPRRHWPRWASAFEALSSDEARVPWHDPKTGNGAARRVVNLIDIPRNPCRLRDWLKVSVHLPPGSKCGPLVDRLALRSAGVTTAAAYRLLFSLSFWWHEPGVTRTPVPKGPGRGRRWLQARDWSRYRTVRDEMLVAMAFPHGEGAGSTHRKRLERARRALEWLAGEGTVEVHGDRATRVIRPGPDWAGWCGDNRSQIRRQQVTLAPVTHYSAAT